MSCSVTTCGVFSRPVVSLGSSEPPDPRLVSPKGAMTGAGEASSGDRQSDSVSGWSMGGAVVSRVPCLFFLPRGCPFSPEFSKWKAGSQIQTYPSSLTHPGLGNKSLNLHFPPKHQLPLSDSLHRYQLFAYYFSAEPFFWMALYKDLYIPLWILDMKRKPRITTHRTRNQVA